MAKLRLDCMISGEKGTGKELISKAIFELGKQQWGYADHSFISFNFSGVPEGHTEKILFGNGDELNDSLGKGFPGLLKFADKGVLYLDGIIQLPIYVQAKLQNALRDKRFIPVGGTKEITFDTKVIFADTGDLSVSLNPHNFYHELYSRMTSAVIKVPPLRERKDDVEMLIAYFVYRFIKDNDLPGGYRFNIAAKQIAKVVDYPFPGNISELEMLVTQACFNAMLENRRELMFEFPNDIMAEPDNKTHVLFDGMELVTMLKQGIITGKSLEQDIKRKLIDYLYRYKYTTTQIAELLGFTEQSLRNFLSRSRKQT